MDTIGVALSSVFNSVSLENVYLCASSVRGPLMAVSFETSPKWHNSSSRWIPVPTQENREPTPWALSDRSGGSQSGWTDLRDAHSSSRPLPIENPTLVSTNQERLGKGLYPKRYRKNTKKNKTHNTIPGRRKIVDLGVHSARKADILVHRQLYIAWADRLAFFRRLQSFPKVYQQEQTPCTKSQTPFNTISSLCHIQSKTNVLRHNYLNE